MGVGDGLYMCDVVKKVHVRYLISWWVLVLFWRLNGKIVITCNLDRSKAWWTKIDPFRSL